ncbi:MAG: flagellar transcriptional regulator FlhD [gamma proteobacterium endosymbiont of Lamellibrachia anaximandri]|nr:flagellar transcriptional regulator FlhD [gamma proteobacterium endosymbiont of Lamellibrachia anaximandri]
MEFDFSPANLHYLIQTRELARQDLALATTLTEIPEEMAALLCKLTSRELTQIARIRRPLLIPRREDWWWSRLFRALSEGGTAEVEAILEQGAVIPLYSGSGQ